MQVNQTIFLDFKNGNISSFYKEVYPSLMSYAVRVLGKEMAYLGEDCVSDSIFKTYQNRHQFNTPLELKAYVYTCVHNEAVTLFRKNERHRRYLDHQRSFEVDFVDSMVMQETLDRLEQALDKLPPRLYEIFTMTFDEGLRRGEIAQRLNVSEATVKRDRQKIISILRETFKDDLPALMIIATIMNVLS